MVDLPTLHGPRNSTIGLEVISPSAQVKWLGGELGDVQHPGHLVRSAHAELQALLLLLPVQHHGSHLPVSLGFGTGQSQGGQKITASA